MCRACFAVYFGGLESLGAPFWTNFVTILVSNVLGIQNPAFCAIEASTMVALSKRCDTQIA
jgi:hypothetical protein